MLFTQRSHPVHRSRQLEKLKLCQHKLKCPPKRSVCVFVFVCVFVCREGERVRVVSVWL